MLNLIKKYSILSFFLLTFIISWGSILILAFGFSAGMPANKIQFDEIYNEFGPLLMLPFLFGPSIAGIIMIGIVDGKKGFRNLLSSLIKWRVNIQWYGVALLIVPVFVIALLSLFSLISSKFLPDIVTSDDKLSLILTGFGLGVSVIFEELGWTGFVVPKLRLRYGSFTTGLIVGIVWAIWHLLPTYWMSGDATGSLSLNLFIGPVSFYIFVLPVFRILMVKVYDYTKSLLVSTLMHGSLTANTIIILSPQASGFNLSVYYIALAVLLWIFYFLMNYRLKMTKNKNHRK